MLTPRQRFAAALDRRPITGRVPHFELVFYLTMEAFGKVHPSQRNYAQWSQMEEKERQLHRREMADIFIMTAERYEHDAIFIHPNPDSVEETLRLVDLIRDKTGDRYFILRHGDATFSIPDGAGMVSFANRIADDRTGLKAEAAHRVDQALREAEVYQKHGGLDGFALCSDYCFNSGPFLSPPMFGELITPYLARLTQAYREMGFYTIKHTDGNILPILDQLAGVPDPPACPALARPDGGGGYCRG
jgi:uroporphyrinogen decarboxylase